MASKKLNLSKEERARPFQGEFGELYPPILTTQQVADLFSASPKTLSGWLSKGHFDGTYRKHGKRCRFWRDRVLDKFFNGKDW